MNMYCGFYRLQFSRVREAFMGLWPKGRPWTTSRIAAGRHALLFYALRECHDRGGPPTGQAACGRLLPPWTAYAVRLWITAG
jgi:hypothetical protein